MAIIEGNVIRIAYDAIEETKNDVLGEGISVGL